MHLLLSDGLTRASQESSKPSEQGISKSKENTTDLCHPHHISSFSQNDENNSTTIDSNVAKDEEEVEELLVDDFDGQCSRTYPDNHSKITRWRELKAKKGKLFCEGGKDDLETHSKSSDVNSYSRSNEIFSDIRCKDRTKTENDSRKPLKNSDAIGFDTTTKNLSNQPSILSDHERDFAAKKRRLMNSTSLDHSKPSSTLTTESNSTGK